ncbi:hypothetical protein HRF87_21855 [Bacillus sp. CRN 9]|nr:hypothetical protein [Bacillus sp. CRN 9]
MSRFETIAEEVTIRIYREDPTLIERYGKRGKEQTFTDNLHHLDYLKAASDLNSTAIFTDYAIWLNGILTKIGMTSQTLIDNFIYLDEALQNSPFVDHAEAAVYSRYLADAIQALQSMKGEDKYV